MYNHPSSPLPHRSYSPTPLSHTHNHNLSPHPHLDHQRRKKVALQSSLLTVSATKRSLQHQLSQLKLSAHQHSLTQQKLQQRQDDILFYQSSLQLIRKDMQNLNQVIHAKNREFVMVTEELELVRERCGEVERERGRLAGVLGEVVEEISGLMEGVGLNIDVMSQLQQDIVTQFRSDSRHILRLYHSMQHDITQLLKINDQIRHQNTHTLSTQKQKSIKLEYQKRLIQQRLNDERRKQGHINAESMGERVHELEVQLLKEQQESQRKLFQVTQMKTSQSSRISDISLEKQNSLQQQIFTLVRRNKELEKEKREIKMELEKVRVGYKAVVEKYSRMNLEVEGKERELGEEMRWMRGVRRMEEDRKRLEIRVEELGWKNRALEEEIGIYRDKERG